MCCNIVSFGCQSLRNSLLKVTLPSVRRARPPVGLHKTLEQLAHSTSVWAWLKTVVIL